MTGSTAYGASGARPYLYEGVFAHEWQHLLHDDYDGDEDTFVNEGCAEMRRNHFWLHDSTPGPYRPGRQRTLKTR